MACPYLAGPLPRAKYLCYHTYHGLRGLSACIFINIVGVAPHQKSRSFIIINILGVACIFFFNLFARSKSGPNRQVVVNERPKDSTHLSEKAVSALVFINILGSVHVPRGLLPAGALHALPPEATSSRHALSSEFLRNLLCLSLGLVEAA